MPDRSSIRVAFYGARLFLNFVVCSSNIAMAVRGADSCSVSPGRGALTMYCRAVGETVARPSSHFPNSSESAEKPLWATLLAEPFPGAVAQGGVLVFSVRFQTIMKQWVGNAHGGQPVRGMWEKRVGRFDFCGGFLDHHRKGGVF